MLNTQQKPQLYCAACKQPLLNKKTHFSYLGHSFHAEVPCCPRCGQAYIDETLAKGRMTNVEMELEDK